MVSLHETHGSELSSEYPVWRDLAVKLQERFLRQIFRLGRVRRHAQAQRIDPPLVLVIKHLKRFRVPKLRPFDGLSFAKFGAFRLSWLGQVVCSGRTHWDAA